MDRAVFTLMLCVGLIGSNGLILAPVLADIAVEFDDGIASLARAMSAFGAATAITALTLGRALDRFGCARALRLAMVVGGLGQILAAQSGSWVGLSAAQALTGAASGVALPAIYALTAEVSKPGQESKTMGLVVMGWSLSLVMALPLGAWLADLYGWRMMLRLIGGLCVATIILSRHLPHGRADPVVDGTMGRFGPLFLPGGWLAYLICGLFMVCFYGSFALTGAHAVQHFGQSTAAAGLVSMAYGLGLGAMSFAGGVIDRFGARRIRLWGFPAAAATFLFLASAPTFNSFLLGIFLWGGVNALLLNTILTGLTSLAPAAKSTVMGLYSATTYLAGAFGTALMSQFFQKWGFYSIGVTAAALHVLAFLLLISFYTPPRSGNSPAQS